MPLCRKCSNAFPNRIKVDGKTRVLSNRKFCLTCSPFGKHNTRDITRPGTPLEKPCSRCKVVKKADQYHSRGSVRKHNLQPHCKACDSKMMQESKLETKLWSIMYKGGKCQRCGYKKYGSVLEFHHRNPKEKDFKITEQRRCRTKEAKDKLRRELDKCDLLCSNCHRETHSIQRGDLTIEKLKKIVAKR